MDIGEIEEIIVVPIRKRERRSDPAPERTPVEPVKVPVPVP
jgi:hypothetical protein